MDKFECEECKDTGYVGDSHAGRFGYNTEYMPCDCKRSTPKIMDKKEFEEKFINKFYECTHPDSKPILSLKNPGSLDELWLWIEQQIKEQREEMPELMKFLSKVESEPRSAATTTDCAKITINSDGSGSITISLNGVRPISLYFSSLSMLYRDIINAKEPE